MVKGYPTQPYIPMRRGFVYLVAILDWATRKVRYWRIGSLRDECLNVHWFDTIEHAKEVIEHWRADYNESRPHMALGNIPPNEFARGAGDSTDHQDP
jgi:transposase InsO family protein